MKQDKRKAYTLKASIHTLQIDLPNGIGADKVTNDIEEAFAPTIRSDGTGTVIINPNRVDKDCFSWSEFCKQLDFLLETTDITDFVVKRCDLRLDTYGAKDYKRYAKLNKLLISLMATAYTTKNCYISRNMWTDEQISCAIKNPYFQVENYNREYKNFVTSNCIEIATSRFEERSMAKAFNQHDPSTSEQLNNIRTEFLVAWKKRWEKALEKFPEVCDRYNTELVKIWYDEQSKTNETRFRTVNEFVRFYQNNIFCRKQLVDLLTRLGYTEAQAKELAGKWKTRYKFEWFSKKDVNYAAKEIHRATEEFFER